MVKTGSSYASQSELPLTFGLGRAAGVDSVRVVWPGGATERIGAIDANRSITIKQGAGVIQTTEIVRRAPSAPKR
jgi:hypothetical protein